MNMMVGDENDDPPLVEDELSAAESMFLSMIVLSRAELFKYMASGEAAVYEN